ncbi:MAG: hypothetical protein QM657_15770, partial [Lacrimispora sp.]|uniref:hypothetical protein n=1 Tax=Lacrimispora sp. TaxID=2719234 RepID=UPI0039E28E5B
SERSFLPPVSAASYIITKGEGNVNNFFSIFLFILKNVIFTTIPTFNWSLIFLIAKTRLQLKVSFS